MSLTRRLGRRARATLAILATCTLGAVILPAVILPTAAQAEYNGAYYFGCTYSWGNVCFSPYQHIKNIFTMDSDHAYFTEHTRKTNNGYPLPKQYPGESRDVCGAVWNEGRQTVPWSCGWGTVWQEPEAWGQSIIGGAEYYQIALYQALNEPYIGGCCAVKAVAKRSS